MRLVVIRHAIAEDRDTFAATGRDDASRPLTDEGKRKMRRTARGLRRLIPRIETIVASPLTRARETAEIVRDEYGMERVETAVELEPECPLADVVAALARYPADLAAVVGHEPQLSRLVTYLVSGVDRSGLELKKGGACLIEFDDRPSSAAGQMLWALRPSTLRDLAG